MRMVQVPFGNARISRLAPDLGPEYYKTYTMSSPFASHWKPATCEEYECEDFLNGFVLTVDLGTELGQKQYHYVTHDRDRRHSMQRISDHLIKFVYGPGNPCFRRGDHKVPLDRPPFYLVSGGDWRGNPRGIRRMVHRRPEDWVDDFANHQDSISEAVKRG